MKKTSTILGGLILGLILLGIAPPAYSQSVVKIKLGTVAPKDTLWHQVLQEMAQDWKEISGGTVKVTIYPGGNMGDEVAMLRKVRLGQLQAVALSGAGLSHAEPGVSCLQVPMMISSYAELDYVRERMAPKLEAKLEDKGFTVLNWGDVGWVHFFTEKPARTLDDIRKMKLFISAGDPETEKLYREFGFHPVPMPVTDMVAVLQTGLIDAFDVPPLFALSNQSFPFAKNMIDVKWAALVGATIVHKDAWERIPAALRPKLLASARKAGEKLREDIRRLGDESVVAMQMYGLKVTELDEAARNEWRAEAEAAYPKLRGRLVPAELFDEVLRLRDEYRSKQKSTDGAGGSKNEP